MKYTNATKINRKSGGAQWRDLLFIIPVSNLNGSVTLPFVIPTGAKRSGGICSAPVGAPEFSV
jgi:hypothetical protein